MAIVDFLNVRRDHIRYRLSGGRQYLGTLYQSAQGLLEWLEWVGHGYLTTVWEEFERDLQRLAKLDLPETFL